MPDSDHGGRTEAGGPGHRPKPNLQPATIGFDPVAALLLGDLYSGPGQFVEHPQRGSGFAGGHLDRRRHASKEIIGRSGPLRTAEVPFTFQPRLSGESKASAREGVRLLTQVARLRMGAVAGAARQVASLLAIGASGIAVNTGLLWVLAGPLELHYLVASALATQVAIGWNFGWLDRTLFPGAGGGRLRRLARFWFLAMTLLPVQLGLLALLVSGVGLRPAPANLVVLAVVFGLRYVVSKPLVLPRRARGRRPRHLGAAVAIPHPR